MGAFTFRLAAGGSTVRGPDAFRAVAGQIFLLSVAGTLTSAGALVKGARKILAGATSPTGVLLKEARKVLVATVSSSGLLVKEIRKILIGTLTSAGAVANIIPSVVSVVRKLRATIRQILSLDARQK